MGGFGGAWSPDSQTVAYTSSPGGSPKVYTMAIHGSAPIGPLTREQGSEMVLDWSADGRYILFSEHSNDLNVANASALRALSVADGKTVLVAQVPFDRASGRFSQDTKWVAYASRESGRYEVYVKSFPEGGGQWLVSGNGGEFPIWRKDGRELFYLAPDQTLVSVAVRPMGAGLESDPRRRCSRSPSLYAWTRRARRNHTILHPMGASWC